MRKLTAQKLCSYWHGGQWSALYQYSSSGLYAYQNALKYLQEIETCLHPEYNLYPSVLSKKNEKELNSLKQYFTKLAKDEGIDIGWGKHSVYGYNFPYVRNNPHCLYEIGQLIYAI
jgi:hypothetical protein